MKNNTHTHTKEYLFGLWGLHIVLIKYFATPKFMNKVFISMYYVQKAS